LTGLLMGDPGPDNKHVSDIVLILTIEVSGKKGVSFRFLQFCLFQFHPKATKKRDTML
jgi:hypothetical protein